MNRFLTRVSNLIRLLREKGFSGLWARILKWAWQTPSQYLIVCRHIKESLKPPQTKDILFRIAQEKDLQWICRNMSHQGESAERLAKQHLYGKDITIVGALRENFEKLAFSVCLTPNDFGMNLLGDIVSPNDVGIRRGWVPPELRSLGIGTQGMQYAEYVGYKKGIKRFWGFVYENNESSLKMIKKAGYEPVGRIALITRLGRRYAKLKKNSDKKWRYIRVPFSVTRF